jgi:glycosyltransferase involved in cell wall biosynthesis
LQPIAIPLPILRHEPVTIGRADTGEVRVLQVVLQLSAGGTERLVIELVRRLRERFPMAVCCLDEPGEWAPEITGLGVEVTALHRPPGFQIALARKLASVATRFDASVLHCHHYSPFVYGRLASLATRRTRVVFTEHGRLSDAPPSGKRRLANRFLTIGSPWLFAVSHDLRRHLVAEGFPARMSVIWNGIDPGPPPDERRRRSARRSIAVPEDASVIGTVARLDPVKDLGTLLEAFAEVQRRSACRLVVIGDGAEEASLRARARALQIEGSVLWLGQRGDVREILPAFDVYANSSISEGISLTLLEAMAAQLPVVATRVGGTPEVVLDGETGLLGPARSAGALAALVQRLVDDKPLAARFGLAGRHRVCEHFALDRMVERYAAVYERSARGPAAEA